MSDTAPDTGTPGTEPTPQQPEPEPTPDTGPDEVEQLKTELERLKSIARKQEDRAKANAKAAQELEQLRQATMSEQEKAVAQAREEGRKQAITEFGGQLVDAEIRAVAAGRLDDRALNVLFQSLNRAAFLNEDGTVDQKSVAEFVSGIAPPPPPKDPAFPDLGQGVRSAPAALNGDPLLRDLKARLGIS